MRVAAVRGFIRNPQAVLLLAACRTLKSDRLLDVGGLGEVLR